LPDIPSGISAGRSVRTAPLALSNGNAGAGPPHFAAPQTVIGTDPFRSPPPSATPGVITSPGGDISFNFVNADIRDVVREILGNQLHLDYVVDPKVQGTVTAQTSTPVPRSAVLPTLESILHASGVTLLHVGNVYQVIPLEGATKAGAATIGSPNAGGPGFGVRVLPLKFVPAADMKSILDPFVPTGGTLQADGTRNVLIVSGPTADLTGFADLVRQFDVDWLAGKSLGIYPLHIGTAKDVADEVQQILQENGKGPTSLSSLVRVVPIQRLNAVLVISTQPAYLLEVKSWIERLDYGDDETTPKIFEYRVQNSRASDLALVLSKLLSPGSVQTAAAQTVPGGGSAQIGSQNGGATNGGFGNGTAGQSGGLGQAGAGGGLTSNAAGAAGGIGQTPSGFGQQAQGQQGQGQQGTGGYGQPNEQGGNEADQQQSIAEALGGENASASSRNLQTPPVRIVADDKNNALVIYARPRDYRMIEDIIRRLDVVPLQVLIEATIAEVTLSDSLQYGLQYYFKTGASKFEFNNINTGNLTAADIAGVFPGFNYALTASNQAVVLNLLRSVSKVNVISAPQLLVLDHRTASLEVGQQVPIITQTAQSLITTDAPAVNSIEYRNTGVLLQVTPRVNSTGLVTLDIDQEVSDVANTTSSSLDSPTINDRHITTSVVVRDGETIALGGLITENHSDTRNGIPVLSDIPLIGALFRNTSRSTGRTELFVLLSPTVVRNPIDANQMTNDLRDKMRALKPLNITVR
jgi:general secretion pathway protein D